MNALFAPTASAGGQAGFLGLHWVCLALGLAGLAVLFWGLWKAVVSAAARPCADPLPPPAAPQDPEPEPAALLSDFLKK